MTAPLPALEGAARVVASTAHDGVAGSRVGTTVSTTYHVTKLLGSGGMGEVYEVEHARLGRRFAAKFLRSKLSSDATAVERFQSEARALATVRSAQVVSIVDSGSDSEGVPFFVMEHLVGSDLKTLLKQEGPLTLRRACGLTIAAAAGLRAVHDAGFIHGDVKPANLFVCRGDLGIETCKLLDLGLARSTSETTLAAKTTAGTLRYMAPEQLVDPQAADQRADIYALGVVLYECISGRPPHVGECVERTIFAVMHSRPAPLAGRGIAVPRELENLVFRALAPEPATRFPTAASFIDALAPFALHAHAAATNSSAPDDSTHEIRSSWLPSPRRRRALPLLLIAAGIVVGATGTLSVRLGDTPGRAAVEPLLTPSTIQAGAAPKSIESHTISSAPQPTPATPNVAGPPATSTRARASTARQPKQQPPPPSSAAVPTLLGKFDRTSPYDHDEP